MSGVRSTTLPLFFILFQAQLLSLTAEGQFSEHFGVMAKAGIEGIRNNLVLDDSVAKAGSLLPAKRRQSAPAPPLCNGVSELFAGLKVGAVRNPLRERWFPLGKPKWRVDEATICDTQDSNLQSDYARSYGYSLDQRHGYWVPQDLRNTELAKVPQTGNLYQTMAPL